jgi:hypothetical protein
MCDNNLNFECISSSVKTHAAAAMLQCSFLSSLAVLPVMR